MSRHRLPSRVFIVCLLTTGAVADGQTVPPLPPEVLRKGFIAAGICRPSDVCTPNAAKWAELLVRAKATEQWQPVPLVVTPAGTASPPTDAIALFDGKSLDAWRGADDRQAARWQIVDGTLVPDKKAGNIETRRQFRNYQLHLEWRIPEGISGTGQARGNSGVFLASTGPGDTGYELQILDSWTNATYANGQAGSIYKQSPPLVNAALPPGRWQSYDVIWTAPIFETGGAFVRPAYVTVLHNGLLIHNHVELKGETVFVGKPFYRRYDRASVKLQAHADPSTPISFRNIWIREMPD